MSDPNVAEGPIYPRAPMAWLTVAILFVLYIRSLADRYLMALMVEPIKQGLHLSDTQFSLLQGPAFAVFYCLCAIPVGLMLDRYSRRWVLFFCILLWSAGAGACGFAGAFAMLMAARALVGAGEAGYTTGAYSIIGDSFPASRLSLAMAVFVMGGVMGAGIVFLLGGPLVGFVLEGGISHWPLMGHFAPWQQAFVITGIPGMGFAFLVFLFPEPRRRQQAAVSALEGYREAWRFIMTYPRCFSGIIFGIGFVYTVTIALQIWSPTFLTRVHGWKPGQIGLAMGLAQLLAALSLPVHGWVVDRLYNSGYRDAHLRWCLITLALAGPLAVAAYLVSNPYATVVLFGLYMTCIHSTSSMGPASVQLVTPTALRGRVTAIFVLMTGLIGMALGTFLVGFVTDKVLGDPAKVGLSMVALVVAGLILAAGFFAHGCAGVRRLLAARAG
ncbi:MFS family permease [Novosphingobium sp. SG751A]|uniref:MFS transporter n=1 Tax=Novosphingobium sp. SG751A TaxID=2587000 RepID=UPI0035303262|nr:MFS family permease [Novosphingobium sp. SG751A]